MQYPAEPNSIIGKGVLCPERTNLAQKSSPQPWQKTLFLRDERAETRGWLIEVMKCVEQIGKKEFDLDDVYAFEAQLGNLYPSNRHVRHKIRQQLQKLRDRGYLDFVSRGYYRLKSPD